MATYSLDNKMLAGLLVVGLVLLVAVIFSSKTPAVEAQVGSQPSTTTAPTTVAEVAIPVGNSQEPEIIDVEAAMPAAEVKFPSVIGSVSQLQDAYFGREGKYLQIKQNGSLPEYETGTVTEKLGQIIPPGVRVDVYDGPRGKGYVIFYAESDANQTTYYMKGFGPDADAWTGTRTETHNGASTTPSAGQ